MQSIETPLGLQTLTFRYVTDLHDTASWFIRRAQLGFSYTHVEAVKRAGAPGFLGAPEGEAYFGARWDGGVTWKPKGYDAAFQFEEIFVDVPVTDVQAAAFWAFLLAQNGKPYDKELIAAFMAGAIFARRDWHQDGHWICSELQAAGCEAGHIQKPYPEGHFAITPQLHLNALAQHPGVSLPAMSAIFALSPALPPMSGIASG